MSTNHRLILSLLAWEGLSFIVPALILLGIFAINHAYIAPLFRDKNILWVLPPYLLLGVFSSFLLHCARPNSDDISLFPMRRGPLTLVRILCLVAAVLMILVSTFVLMLAPAAFVFFQGAGGY